MDPRWRPVVAFAVDLLLVGLFALIGRASHREDESAVLLTALPFAIGLVAGWAAARGWRRPFAILHTTVPAWLGAVVVGMLLRAVTGAGVQVSFVVVASIVLGAFLLGWRFLLVAIDRSTTRTETIGPVGRFLGRR